MKRNFIKRILAFVITGTMILVTPMNTWANTSDSVVNVVSQTSRSTNTVTLSVPKLIGAKASGYNAVKITWKKVPGATGYRVYRKTSENGTYKGIATLGDTSVFTDKTAVGGNRYFYTVKALKKSAQKMFMEMLLLMV